MLDAIELDYKLELQLYREFMQWDDEGLSNIDDMTQEMAKQALINDLEFVLGTNGYSEMYESELELMRKLGILND